MAEMARLTTDGELKIAGNLDTRLPAVTDGLVAHFPFDGDLEYREMIEWTNLSGVSVDPSDTNTLTKISGVSDWVDGAQSVQSFSTGNVFMEWRMRYVNNTQGAEMVGLNHDHSTNSYTDIDFVIYTHVNGSVNIYENGSNKGGFSTWNLDAINIFRIEIVDGVVRYYHNGNLIYTSLNSPIYPLYADCSLHSHGAQNSIIYSYIGAMPSINLNTSSSPEGALVERSTTNALGGVSSFSGMTGSIEEVYTEDSPIDDKVIKWIAGRNDDYTAPYNKGATVVSAGDKVTVSIFAKSHSELACCEFFIFFYSSTDASGDYFDLGASAFYPTAEWGRYSYTLTVPAGAGSAATRLDNNIIGEEVYFTGWQIEKLDYPTSFTFGSRVFGQLAIHNPVKTGNYTVNFRCKINTNIGSPIAYQTIMSMGNYYSNNSWTIMDTNGLTVEGSQKLIRKGNSAEWGWSSGAFSNSTNFKDENMYTIVRDDVNYKCYSNGVYVGSISHLSTTMQDLIWIGSRNSGNHVGSSTISDLSIYNRDLTDAEIQKLYRSSFNIQANGDLRLPKINSLLSPSGDEIYFPFGVDAKNIYKNISPVVEDNITHRDGGLWIGYAITNHGDEGDITPYTGYSTFSHSGTVITRETVNTNGYLVMRSTALYPEQGKTIAVSGYMQINGMPVDYKASSGSRITTYTGWHTIHMLSDPYTGYFEIIVQVDLDAVNGWLFHSPTYATTLGDILTIHDLQIEEKTFNVPHAYLSRGTSKLCLPYNIIDCKQDFTIYGWWYPKTYADGTYRPCLCRHPIAGNSTFNRILIMGNGSTSRRIRCWHGSDGIAESSVYGPNDVLVQNDKWNFFVVRRSGANMQIGLGVDGVFKFGSSAATAYRLDADEDPGTFAWLVGEYSGSKSNAYHRDYMFVQRALSDNEVNEVYNNKMNIDNNYLNIQNGISTGEVI